MDGWQQHCIHQVDAQGSRVELHAERQVLRHPDADYTMPFGLSRMENGEIVLLCSREKGQPPNRIVEPVVAFSQDDGATWSPFAAVNGATGRPQYLHWLGGGSLSFITEVWGQGARPQRLFSKDYGRSWTEAVEHPLTRDGHGFGVEGNGWVDRDAQGEATAVLEIGYYVEAGKTHPKGDYTAVFRRSVDGGRTWRDEVSPPQWKFTMEHADQQWLRGISEGSVVRAANGDLVAALRTDMPPRYFEGPHDDSLEGTAISISRDDGRTWSDLQFLYLAGRHHANLQRLGNGDLVCTLIVRTDIRPEEPAPGPLTSPRRGCDAVVSHDHGRTWNLERRYELDAYDFLRADGYWVDGVCGHLASAALPDGQVLTVYGNYRVGAVLIKWRP